MYVCGHLQGTFTFNSRHYRSHLYSVLETVLGLQQVDVLLHVQKSEQAIWADEQLHICEEHGLALLQVLLINLKMTRQS